MTLVRAPEPHACKPPLEAREILVPRRPGSPLTMRATVSVHPPVGTVFHCGTCARVWVVARMTRRSGYPRVHSEWRPAGWFAARRARRRLGLSPRP